jgi:KaiC/GvpD/RAD55 family RecA-like ATPase
MERVKTGVPGLDEMLNGGLIGGRSYLICGGPGAGKTIFAVQFLLEGITNGEKCLYISLEETAEEIRQDMSSFGWNVERIDIIDTAQEMEDSKIFIRSPDSASHPEFTLTSLRDLINHRLDCCDLKRIVIDSLSSVMALYDNEVEMRKNILSLMNFLSNTECTTIMIDEKYTRSKMNIPMEEFLAAGVIKIHTIEKKGEMIRGISIEKLRGSDFDKHIRPMKVTNSGIIVFPDATLFD